MTKSEMYGRLATIQDLIEFNREQPMGTERVAMFLQGARTMLQAVIEDTNEQTCDDVKWDYIGAGFFSILALAVPVGALWILFGGVL